MKRLASLVLVGTLAGCAGRTPTPTPDDTPSPTPVPWSIEVTDVEHTQKARVGNDIEVVVNIENNGHGASQGTSLYFTDQESVLDLIGCVPECTYSDLLGLSLDLPGVAAGAEVTYRVGFLAKAVGAVDIGLCVFDDLVAGQEVWCGSLPVVVRK